MTFFFISYARKDGIKFADELNHRLDEAGLLGWIDREDLKPGKHWRPSLVKAIDSSLATLVVITPGALASDYVMREWMRAEAQNKDVIPLMFAEIPSDHMDRAIFDLQCLDFKSPTEANWDELIERLRQIEAKKSVDPEVARAEAILKSAETDKWEGALKFLEICTHESATEALVRVINGHLPEVSIRAALALDTRTNFRDVRSFEALKMGLIHPTLESNSIDHLSQVNTPEAVVCLVDHWTIRYGRSFEHDSWERPNSALLGLTRMTHPSIYPILIEVLGSREELYSKIIVQAIDSLCIIGDRASIEQVADFLGDYAYRRASVETYEKYFSAAVTSLKKGNTSDFITYVFDLLNSTSPTDDSRRYTNRVNRRYTALVRLLVELPCPPDIASRVEVECKKLDETSGHWRVPY